MALKVGGTELGVTFDKAWHQHHDHIIDASPNVQTELFPVW
jgi:hypothetical protein